MRIVDLWIRSCHGKVKIKRYVYSQLHQDGKKKALLSSGNLSCFLKIETTIKWIWLWNIETGVCKNDVFPYKNKFHQAKIMKFSLRKNWNVKNMKYSLLKQFNQAQILNLLSITDRRSTNFQWIACSLRAPHQVEVGLNTCPRSSSNRQNFFPSKLGIHHMPRPCCNVPSFNRSNVIKCMQSELDFVCDIYTHEMLFREL